LRNVQRRNVELPMAALVEQRWLSDHHIGAGQKVCGLHVTIWGSFPGSRSFGLVGGFVQVAER
jgi:hypothetical protein